MRPPSFRRGIGLSIRAMAMATKITRAEPMASSIRNKRSRAVLSAGFEGDGSRRV
ncbi:MAG: hypothetical protein GXY73_04700 [Methanothrix sp.]|nr:hypothetical protein [Methanothrix sp.]